MRRPSSLMPPSTLDADRTVVLSPDRIVTLGEELGQGAVATVFRGVLDGPHGVSCTVAVKVFDAVASEDREPLLVATRDAVRSAAWILHPNVAQTHEFTTIGASQPVVVTELVDGRSLAALVDAYAASRRRFPTDLALFIGAEIAEAFRGSREARTADGFPVDMCHAALSSNQVQLSWRGEVKVTDFGLGRVTPRASGVRPTGAFAARARTMAPEVARGSNADARSDVFALGIILREMLVGPRFPIGTGELEALQFARDGYVDAPMFHPSPPPPVADVIRRAIEIDPADRWAHASVMAFELRRACLSMGVGDTRLFLQSALAEMLGSKADITKPARHVHMERPRAEVPPERWQSGPRLKGSERGSHDERVSEASPATAASTRGGAPNTTGIVEADVRRVHRVTRPDPEDV